MSAEESPINTSRAIAAPAARGIRNRATQDHQRVERERQQRGYQYGDKNRFQKINQTYGGRRRDHKLGDDSSLHRPAKKFYFLVWSNVVCRAAGSNAVHDYFWLHSGHRWYESEGRRSRD